MQVGQFASIHISWMRDWAFLFFLQGRGRQIIWRERNGCVDRSRGPRQRRRELPGLIVLRRQGIEDDEEAFPWECCCVLLETDTFPYLLPGEKQTLAAHMKGSFPGSVWAASRSNRALIEFEGEREREGGREVQDLQQGHAVGADSRAICTLCVVSMPTFV